MASIEPRPRIETGREPDLLTYIWALPNFHELANNPSKVLDAIDKFNTEENRLINVGPKKGAVIDKVIEERRPSTMIEMGGYVGYSAIKFGDTLRRAGGKKYYSLEINPINASVAKMLIELAGLQDIVTVIVAPSHEALAQLVQEGAIEKIELLFFDHWEDRYRYDLWFVERLGLLNRASLLVADNISPEAGRGVDYVDWLKATAAAKEEILKAHELSDDFESLNLAMLIKEKGVKGMGVDLGNVEGVPTYIYETKIHPFEGHSGRMDGVAITKVLSN
ncbi:O-methyltransferase [Penicillium longicatenatum]|uniref:O-methyltransferase n=1 Tax=Penicillium longicatenatum TaxID=1561947 RepID=UPI0025471CC3|nr:O-methyltransferase [Penicillium longicatenatum]KAJ5630474.1 O-methyltransferase [Penicillium longicatenatum]